MVLRLKVSDAQARTIENSWQRYPSWSVRQNKRYMKTWVCQSIYNSYKHRVSNDANSHDAGDIDDAILSIPYRSDCVSLRRDLLGVLREDLEVVGLGLWRGSRPLLGISANVRS